jgi:signal transduction histidine kinase/CheY-like chemotaxis protein
MTMPPAYRQAVLAEQMRYMRKTLPGALGGNFLGVACTAFVLWRVMPTAALPYWFGAAVVQHVLVAAGTFMVFNVGAAALAQTYRRMRAVAAMALLQGTLWAAGFALFFPPAQPAIQFALLYALALVTAGTLFVSALYFPMLVAFVIPYTLMEVAVLLMQGTTLHTAFAAGVVVFTLLMLFYGWHIRSLFIQSLVLRFENVGLVDELTVQKETAVAANQAKSRFLAAANHDLRQPMHALNFYLSALAGSNLPAPAQNLLTNGQVCARVMDDMFRQLLDISQLDAAVVCPEIEAFPIGPLLEQLVVQLGPEAQAKGLRLQSAPCRVWVWGDSRMVARILRNFVANAIRYTERGRILIGCRRRGTRLRIGVYDTGIGIAPEARKAVFEEFYQVGNAERDHANGLGLGLAIADRLARLQGTAISLASEPGRGSVFAIDLPLAPAPSADQPADPNRPPAGHAAGPTLAGKLVAVVDDDAMILDAVSALLVQWGCVAVAAANGDEAREKLATALAEHGRIPDLLICDYRLRSGQNGAGVVQALREEFNIDIPAVLVTGDTAPERLQEIQASGLPVLHKPLNAGELRAALMRLLAGQPGPPAA